MRSNIVNVCISFSDIDGSYIYCAATTLLSVVLHSGKEIKIHVFSDNTLAPKGKSLLMAIAAMNDIEILFHTVNVELLKKIMMPEQYKFGLGSFYRFFIPEVIENGVAIYFDCDILCLTNVIKLRDQIYESENYYACVVQDSYVGLAQYLKQTLEQRGFSYKKYFNSGVIVFNCDKVNALFDSFSNTLIKICYDFRDSPFIDQDSLNAAFSKIKIKWMKVDYNYMMNINSRFIKSEKQLSGKILHFANIKPWMAPELPPSIIYLKYYKQVMKIFETIK